MKALYLAMRVKISRANVLGRWISNTHWDNPSQCRLEQVAESRDKHENKMMKVMIAKHREKMEETAGAWFLCLLSSFAYRFLLWKYRSPFPHIRSGDAISERCTRPLTGSKWTLVRIILVFNHCGWRLMSHVFSPLCFLLEKVILGIFGPELVHPKRLPLIQKRDVWQSRGDDLQVQDIMW